MDVNDFWKASDAGGASLAEIQAVEKRLGLSLPSLYVQLMQMKNGGVPVRQVASLPRESKSGEDHLLVTFDEIGDSVIKSEEIIKRRGMPSKLVLLGGDGNTWLALDYRSCGPTGEPPVVWVENEYNEVMKLARTFEDFVSTLQHEEDDDELAYSASTENFTDFEFDSDDDDLFEEDYFL